MNKTLASAMSLIWMLCICTSAIADTFGAGAGQFEMEFVEIGDPGNAPDTTGNPNPAGSVDYVYRIGKFEVSRDMVEKASDQGGLEITLSDMSNLGGNGPQRPATGVSWNEAARFINWLNTDLGFPAAYKFSAQPGDADYRANSHIELWEPGDPGFDPANPFRNSRAHYFLPGVHEWYKAAYHDPSANDGGGSYWDFPTGSDAWPTPIARGTVPGTVVYKQHGPTDVTQAGGLSPYGVMGMAGNVFEWEETELDLTNDDSRSRRAASGDDWAGDPFPYFLSASDHRYGLSPSAAESWVGFRVASVPGLPPQNLLWAGDADQDLDFDQFDLIQVQVAAKYLTGRVATWGEGDWDGAPGGSPGSPPAGDGAFDQKDIVAALAGGHYLTGAYAAIQPGGDYPEHQVFRGAFGSSFSSLAFGNAAEPGLTADFVADHFTVDGSVFGGGATGDVDLISVPEPNAVILLALGLSFLAAGRRRRHSTLIRSSRQPGTDRDLGCWYPFMRSASCRTRVYQSVKIESATGLKSLSVYRVS